MDFQAFKDDINAVEVAPEVLGDVMVMYASVPAAEQTFEGRAKRVIALLGEKGYGPDCGMLAMAITVRLMALDVVLDDEGVQRWTLPGDAPGRSYVHACVLRAASEETVCEGAQGQPIFELEGFRARVLQLTLVSGSS